MGLIAFEDYESLFRDILTSRLKVIGWGAAALMPYHQLEIPLPLSYLVDRTPQLCDPEQCGHIPVRPISSLRDEDPDNTVVLVFSTAFIGEILEELADIGPFRVFCPLDPNAGFSVFRSCLIAHQAAGKALPGWAEPLALRISKDPVTHWQSMLKTLVPTVPAVPVARRACLVTGSLRSGGAERQLCYLAIGLKRRGWDVEVITTHDGKDDFVVYQSLLDKNGISRRTLPSPRELPYKIIRKSISRSRESGSLDGLSFLPAFMIHESACLSEFFKERNPELVVSYLDRTNILSGVAGLLANVPYILLSGRNLSPAEFPHAFYDEGKRYKDAYNTLLSFTGIKLSNNSSAGARSYAKWLGIEVQKIPVVWNAVISDEASGASFCEAAGQTLRQDLGISPDAPLILGLMRLAEEKQPELFVRVISALRRRIPGLRAMIAGVGPLQSRIEAEMLRLGLDRTLLLLGRREDTSALLAASDLLLMTSKLEGLPNALLEAQLAGRPVVTTRAGGAQDCLLEALHPYSHDIDDVEGLTESCARLLANRAESRRLMAGAGDDIRSRFTLDALVTGTLRAAGLEYRNNR